MVFWMEKSDVVANWRLRLSHSVALFFSRYDEVLENYPTYFYLTTP